MMSVKNSNNNIVTYFKKAVLCIIFVEGILHTKADELKVCEHNDCWDTAKLLKARISQNVNPCENFYKYACGLYVDYANGTQLAPHDIMEERMQTFSALYFEDKLQLSDPDKLYSTTRAIYDKCISMEHGPESMRDLEFILCWSAVNESCKYSHKDVYEFYSNARDNGYFANDLFSIYVNRDKKDSSRHVVYIDRPGTQSDFFGPAFDHLSLHSAYDLITNDFLSKLIIKLGGKPNRVNGIIEGIREFHTRVLNAWAPYKPNDYRLIKVEYLDKWPVNTNASWKKLINTIIWPSSLQNTDEIATPCIDCLATIGKIMKDDPIGTVQYGVLGILLNSAPHGFKELRDLVTESSEEYCRYSMSRLFYQAFDYAYSEYLISDIGRPHEKTKQMFGFLKEQMIEILETNKIWDQTIKQDAQNKIRQMQLYYGYYSGLTYPLAVEEIKPQVEMTSPSYLIPISQFIRRAYFKRMFKKLNEPPDAAKKHFSATSLDVHYDYQENAVSAAVYKHYASWNLPDAVNYGIMGTILAHEMTHAFDSQGRLYNANRTYFQTRPKTYDEALDKVYACFRNQNFNYVNPETRNEVNGSKTMQESFADTGGAFIAYYAFSKVPKWDTLPLLSGFTEDQYFWISYASRFCSKYASTTALERDIMSIHVPNYFRVNGVVSNIAGFRTAFNCKECEICAVEACNLYT